MRFANLAGRLTYIPAGSGEQLAGAAGVDVHTASGGVIPAAPELALERWDEVLEWARGAGEIDDPATQVAVELEALGAASPRPRQIFGVGLNYADHGAESGFELPSQPLIFTKFSSSVTGPYGEIALSSGSVDWEVEIAVVIGRRAEHLEREHAWDAVAGLTVGQDLSDRDIQMRPSGMPQFGLGKSLPGFAPLGPLLVTPDALASPNDLELRCTLNDEEVQHSRSSQLIFPIDELIAYLSGILPLLPGDVIFTGTPSGVGMARTPPVYLKAGDRLDSWVEGIGTMSHGFAPVATPAQVGA